MQKRADEYRVGGKRIGLVPTMGYLHEGHLSLVRIAREQADVVVTSVFVNPAQFGPGEDFQDYPRDFERDKRSLQDAGCDVIFNPSVEEMYPKGFESHVEVERMTKVLCGRSRPAHFRGVTTVVAKLFNIVKPHFAVFGQKDYQQARVIQRMVADLNFDVEIIIAPIVREADGLALSSRNEYLSPRQRQEATVLFKALNYAEKEIKKGERNVGGIIRGVRRLIGGVSPTEIDYISIVDPEGLEEISTITGDVLVALAVRFGKARLIDNRLIKLPG